MSLMACPVHGADCTVNCPDYLRARRQMRALCSELGMYWQARRAGQRPLRTVQRTRPAA
jgi:hypothetical protein